MEQRNSSEPEPGNATDEENEVTMSITFILQSEPLPSSASRRRPPPTAYTRSSLRPLSHRQQSVVPPAGQTQTHAVSLTLPAGPAVLASLANMGHFGANGGMTSLPADLFASIGGRQQSLESIAGRLAPLLLLVRYSASKSLHF